MLFFPTEAPHKTTTAELADALTFRLDLLLRFSPLLLELLHVVTDPGQGGVHCLPLQLQSCEGHSVLFQRGDVAHLQLLVAVPQRDTGGH